jgi:DinB superfamily
MVVRRLATIAYLAEAERHGRTSMSDATDSSASVNQQLKTFDEARDRFLAAFAQAPDEALPFVPPGDEYAIGVLPIHLLDPIRRYMTVFEQLAANDFGLVDRAGDAAALAWEAERHAHSAATHPTGAERAGMLRDLAAAHQGVLDRFSALDTATFTRQGPVIYPGSLDPYPTSAQDILGWLTDHYDEHTAQVGQLLDQWRAQSGR